VSVAARGYRVLAFEALARNAELLQTTLCASPSLQAHATLFTVALSDRPLTCIASSLAANRGNGVLECAPTDEQSVSEQLVSSPGAWGERTRTQTLRTAMLADFIDDTETVHVLKIDVEGHELPALRGAGRMFAQLHSAA
jgi:FkbM family methyltransferase